MILSESFRTVTVPALPTVLGRDEKPVTIIR